jgi:hypothetical protein
MQPYNEVRRLEPADELLDAGFGLGVACHPDLLSVTKKGVSLSSAGGGPTLHSFW